MATYIIEHPTTGQKIQLEGDGVPTDIDIKEAFSKVPSASRKEVQGKPDASAAETERMRNAFVNQEGTLKTRARNMLSQAFNPKDAIAPADSPSDWLGRVLPRSATQLLPKVAAGAYEAVKGQTDPFIEGMANTTDPQAMAKARGQMQSNAATAVKGTGAAMLSGVGFGMDKDNNVNWSPENAKNAWLSDPAMAAAGIAPMVKPARAALAEMPGTIKNTALAAGEKIGVTPEKLYASSLKQSTAIPFEQRAANVKTGLEGGYIPNKKGLGKLYEDINGLNDNISTAIKESAQGGKLIPVEDIITRLGDVKQRAIDSFGDNKSVLAKIDEFADSLREHPSVVDGSIPIDVAQKMKVNTYKQLKNAYGELKGFEVEAKKAMARGAKEEIVAQIPELAALNAKDSTLINLEKVLFKAVNRIENRDMVGIGVPIKVATGAMHGGVGALLGLVAGLIDTPAIKAHIAIALHKARGRAATPAEIAQVVNNIKQKAIATTQGDNNANLNR